MLQYTRGSYGPEYLFACAYLHMARLHTRDQSMRDNFRYTDNHTDNYLGYLKTTIRIYDENTRRLIGHICAKSTLRIFTSGSKSVSAIEAACRELDSERSISWKHISRIAVLSGAHLYESTIEILSISSLEKINRTIYGGLSPSIHFTFIMDTVP